jgi:hypothetical protein
LELRVDLTSLQRHVKSAESIALLSAMEMQSEFYLLVWARMKVFLLGKSDVCAAKFARPQIVSLTLMMQICVDQRELR